MRTRQVDFRSFYRLSILGVVLLSLWIPPQIVATQQRRLDEIETENMTLRNRVRSLERRVKLLKQCCPGEEERDESGRVIDPGDREGGP
jgi:hypothetical protein